MGSSIYRKTRNSNCRIQDDLQIKGCRAISLENEVMHISLLLDKGAEPIRWLHKPTDTDLIWFASRGLMPSHPVFADYQMTYFGGWQEMFPEVSETHSYRGATLHRGESAIMPWDYEIMKDEPEEVAVRLTVRLRSMPFRIEKTIRLTSGSTKVRIDEIVHNESPVYPLEANWGHHLAYGPPFLTESCTVELEENARIHNPASQESWNWPLAYEGEHKVDLSRLPPSGTERDLLYVTVPEGEYRIVSPERGIGLKVRWDQAVWPYLWYWQNFRSEPDHPFFGCDYNIGLEMFNVPPKLTVQQAAQAGLALRVPPLGSLSSWIEFEIEQR